MQDPLPAKIGCDVTNCINVYCCHSHHPILLLLIFLSAIPPASNPSLFNDADLQLNMVFQPLSVKSSKNNSYVENIMENIPQWQEKLGNNGSQYVKQCLIMVTKRREGKKKKQEGSEIMQEMQRDKTKTKIPLQKPHEPGWEHQKTAVRKGSEEFPTLLSHYCVLGFPSSPIPP